MTFPTFQKLSLYRQDSFLYFLSQMTQVAKKYNLRFAFYRLPTRQLSFDLSYFLENKKKKKNIAKQNLVKDLVVVFSFENTLISSWSELRISPFFKAFVFNPLRETFGGKSFDSKRDFFSMSKNQSSFRYLVPNLVWHLDKGNVEVFKKEKSENSEKDLADQTKLLKNIALDLQEVLKKSNEKDHKKTKDQSKYDTFFWLKDSGSGGGSDGDKDSGGGGSGDGDKRKNPLLKSTSKKSYELAVKKLLSLIDARVIKKAVLSMVQVIRWKKKQDILVLKAFAKALNLYSESMVTLFSSPCLGTWLIASPETLVSVSNRHYRNGHYRNGHYLANVDNSPTNNTYDASDEKIPSHVFCIFSLAGTQPLLKQKDVSEVRWSEKEIEEQAMVSRDIIDAFKTLRLREYTEMGPRTVQSGLLLHLASRFIVDIEKDYGMQLVPDIVPLLHPTSAVVGQPRLKAFELIDELEVHNRECYTGYFGPIGLGLGLDLGHGQRRGQRLGQGLKRFCEVELFVNLRSMQYFGNQSVFYAGAGIVRGSVPKKEWEECRFKIKTLQSLFEDTWVDGKK